MTWNPGHLRWTVQVGDRHLAAGTVRAPAGIAEQVALDALADYAGLAGLSALEMAPLTCTVAPDGWPSVVLAVADGRDW